jgi:chemotaxis protein histidine kinase CheA
MAEDTSKKDADLSTILTHLKDAAEERKTDRTRMDAMEKKFDAAMGVCDSIKSRMDAEDKKREEDDCAKNDAALKDAEKEEEAKKDAALKDKALKDAEEETKKKEEEAKKDAARKDAAGPSNADLAKQLEAMNKMLTAPELAEADRNVMVGIQARFEPLHQAFGDSQGAPRWVRGETARQYEIRLASKYKKDSPTFKDSDLNAIGDSAAFNHAITTICNDAAIAANSPAGLPPDILYPREFVDATKRTITKFIGSPGACWNRFKAPFRFVQRWGNEKDGTKVF